MVEKIFKMELDKSIIEKLVSEATQAIARRLSLALMIACDNDTERAMACIDTASKIIKEQDEKENNDENKTIDIE